MTGPIVAMKITYARGPILGPRALQCHGWLGLGVSAPSRDRLYSGDRTPT
jgi:hypothetical protein